MGTGTSQRTRGGIQTSSLVLHRSMTMDQYGPGASDFPRRLNDEMVHVLSPATTTLAFPSSILRESGHRCHLRCRLSHSHHPHQQSHHRQRHPIGRRRHRKLERPALDDGEAPPTYDEVELEACLIHSLAPMPPPPTASAPAVTGAGAPIAPPPAFRPETPGPCSGEATTAPPTR
jgi:hypothetical protein